MSCTVALTQLNTVTQSDETLAKEDKVLRFSARDLSENKERLYIQTSEYSFKMSKPFRDSPIFVVKPEVLLYKYEEILQKSS